MLLIGGEKAVLEKKILVGETARPARVVAGLVSGDAKNHLHVLARDKLEALAAAVTVQHMARRAGLPKLVVAHLLLQPRRDRDDRRGPVRLLGLDLRDLLEPGHHDAVIGMGCRAGGLLRSRAGGERGRRQNGQRRYAKVHSPRFIHGARQQNAFSFVK